ncbi:hypothetical protein JHK86_020770 [Glycine max]|nr:hypothetical protein JHK86_020770 [Glycine max]
MNCVVRFHGVVGCKKLMFLPILITSACADLRFQSASTYRAQHYIVHLPLRERV